MTHKVGGTASSMQEKPFYVLSIKLTKMRELCRCPQVTDQQAMFAIATSLLNIAALLP